MPDRMLKYLPWFYIERSAPSRMSDFKSALEAEEAANDD